MLLGCRRATTWRDKAKPKVRRRNDVGISKACHSAGDIVSLTVNILEAKSSRSSSCGKPFENSRATLTAAAFTSHSYVSSIFFGNVDDGPGAWSIFLEKVRTLPKIEVVESAGMNTCNVSEITVVQDTTHSNV